MPRVKQVVAAKDYPDHGIKKGELHHYWKRKTGPRSSVTYRQIAPPRIEQMTGSAYKIAMHYIEEARNAVIDPDGMDDLISSIEELAAEQREKFDNMPEGLQQGDTGQTLEQQADTLDAAVEELNTIKDEWQQALDEHETLENDFEEYESAHAEWESGDQSGDEPDEVEDPGEFDHDEYTGRVTDVQLEA